MFVIVTKPDCPFCDKAKKLIRMNDDSFSEYSVAEHPILRDFLKSNDLHTVPQIYLKGYHVGGYTDLEDFYEEERWIDSLPDSEEE